MLVSAVPDPSAFDANYFDDLYKVQAEDFLKGIEKNGLLIVDSGKRLQDALIRQIKAVPSKYGQRLQILLAELLKNRKKRIVAWPVEPNAVPSRDLLDLAYHLKIETKSDALIVADDSLKTLKSEQKYDASIVPLSDYRNSDFEKKRQESEKQVGPIDKLPKTEVDDLIIDVVRFTKWVRFYDPYIGKGGNTRRFLRGIDYILTLWHNNGLFVHGQGPGKVEIFTCSANQIWGSDTVQEKRSKLAKNRKKCRNVNRELINRLKKKYPNWQIKLFVKDDPNRIFHARYLETQHAIVRVDKGFDLFKPNGGFQRNLFTLHMDENSQLKDCHKLPDARL